MNNINKYIKYFKKYHYLKNNYNKIGGGWTVIPKTFPKTYSFLFMPLIYYSIDPSNVEFFEGFQELVDECIRSIIDSGFQPLPFTNFHEFTLYLNQILISNKIKNIEDLEKIKDGDHHIPGKLQERITNYNKDLNISILMGFLAERIIDKFPEQKIKYLK
jgi:hypothetical protein